MTDKNGMGLAPQGHPIRTFMEEHEVLLRVAGELRGIPQRIREHRDLESIDEEIRRLDDIVEDLKDSQSHNIREENVLFPYIEKHGITQPPTIMWAEHDRMREIEKSLFAVVDNHQKIGIENFPGQLEVPATDLSEIIASHIDKENNILYPMAMNLLTKDEWEEVKKGCDDLGYCRFTAGQAKVRPSPAKEAARRPLPPTGGNIPFDTGDLSREQLEAILDTLPVDITFVDDKDTVRYFSQSPERIFPRTKAVIGRAVQMCHPQKSVDKVVQIVDDFKNNRRDSAEFWINLRGRTVYIRYFAVRDNGGSYLGTLEVTQDITDIKKIEGEKRLL